MNPYKLNSIAGIHVKAAIAKSLNIDESDVYETIASINEYGVIETTDGKKYKLELKEIKDDKDTNS